MRRVCAWCSSEMEPIEHKYGDVELISHGICVNCSNQLSNPSPEAIQDFLERLPYPVMIVDSDTVILAANNLALGAMGKSEYEVVNKLAGLAVECAHANSGQECGTSRYCQGCEIRESVNETFSTGLGVECLPATLTRSNGSTLVDIQHHISTEKVGDIVLLRLDDLGMKQRY
jgi:hypothetical protein